MSKRILAVTLALASLLFVSCETAGKTLTFKCQAYKIQKNNDCFVYYKPLSDYIKNINPNLIDDQGYIKFYTKISCATEIYSIYEFTCIQRNEKYLKKPITILNQSFSVKVKGSEKSGFLSE